MDWGKQKHHEHHHQTQQPFPQMSEDQGFIGSLVGDCTQDKMIQWCIYSWLFSIIKGWESAHKWKPQIQAMDIKKEAHPAFWTQLSTHKSITKQWLKNTSQFLHLTLPEVSELRPKCWLFKILQTSVNSDGKHVSKCWVYKTVTKKSDSKSQVKSSQSQVSRLTHLRQRRPSWCRRAAPAAGRCWGRRRGRPWAPAPHGTCTNGPECHAGSPDHCQPHS